MRKPRAITIKEEEFGNAVCFFPEPDCLLLRLEIDLPEYPVSTPQFWNLKQIKKIRDYLDRYIKWKESNA